MKERGEKVKLETPKAVVTLLEGLTDGVVWWFSGFGERFEAVRNHTNRTGLAPPPQLNTVY